MITGVILDMDGVIVDSEHQWKVCEGPFFRSVVPAWKDQDHDKIVGLSPEDLYDFLVAQYSIAQSKKDFLGVCHKLAQEIYGERVSLAPNLLVFLDRAKAYGLKLGIASSSPRPWIEAVLGRFGLKERFAAIASGDETPGRTKPHPDLYLLAAKRLGLEPSQCLAIEDSGVGTAAAKAAGMPVVAYMNGHNDAQNLFAAEERFSDFGAFDYATLISRLSRA